ncbi:MAG: hypothetical protein ACI841_003927 [Planctomycetota bacterium]|jgi:hypothetical protein
MKSLANFAVFQAVWFGAVLGACEGEIWLGPIAATLGILVHLCMLPQTDRWLRELSLVASFGIIGSAIDSSLYLANLLQYPTSAESWLLPMVPPWIAALWFATGILPRFSLAWLSRSAWLASIAGALGGPASFLAGRSLGVIESGNNLETTLVVLSIEYAVLVPLLLYAHARWVKGIPRTEDSEFDESHSV